ncbi:MAG TPA: GtrA family protein [Paraburkholderia sp.]|uniref:GtrA family protein n=1 Tax=Paraburkholderia sp. TaxID=1926495 RepID=UPI002ED4A4EB
MPELDNPRRALFRQLGSFVVVGIVCFALNAILVELLVRHCGPLYAQVIAFPIVASVAWYLNRRYTFGASDRSVVQEWMHYIFANLLGWVANNGVYVLLVFKLSLAARHPAIAVAAGSIAGLVFNFVISRAVVFRRA